MTEDEMLKDLDPDEIDLLVELLNDRKSAVAGGELTGFGQSVYDEIDDINALIAKLEA